LTSPDVPGKVRANCAFGPYRCEDVQSARIAERMLSMTMMNVQEKGVEPVRTPPLLNCAFVCCLDVDRVLNKPELRELKLTSIRL